MSYTGWRYEYVEGTVTGMDWLGYQKKKIPQSKCLKTAQVYVLLTLQPPCGLTVTVEHVGHAGIQDRGAAASGKVAACRPEREFKHSDGRKCRELPLSSQNWSHGLSPQSQGTRSTILSCVWKTEGWAYLMNSSNSSHMGWRKCVLFRGKVKTRVGEKTQSWKRKLSEPPKGVSVSLTTLVTLARSPELQIPVSSIVTVFEKPIMHHSEHFNHSSLLNIYSTFPNGWVTAILLRWNYSPSSCFGEQRHITPGGHTEPRWELCNGHSCRQDFTHT